MIEQGVLEKVPHTPGIYLFKNGFGKILYVGKAKRLKGRLSYYFQKNLITGKIELLMREAAKLDFIQTVSEVDALILEADFIKKFRPRYNEALKDDKNYSYIKIGRRGTGLESNFPTVSLVRKVELDRAGYFGPYPNGNSIRKVLKMLRRLFGFRDCSDFKFRRYGKLKHGCLFFDLGLCPAPCCGTINSLRYNSNLRDLKRYLSGESLIIEKDLVVQMKRYSKNLEFEKASELRGRLELLAKLRELKFLPEDYTKNPNLLEDLRREEITDLVRFYNQAVGRPFLKVTGSFRIEAYDISNTSGKNAAAGMVVFINGEPVKSDYRKFRIKTVKGPNDYLMIKETISRRFAHKEWPSPDLILVDGGLGQWGAVLDAIPPKIELAVMGLAKKLERPAVNNKYYIIERNRPALNLLRRVRDEAHRFAKRYHKLLRLKGMMRK